MFSIIVILLTLNIYQAFKFNDARRHFKEEEQKIRQDAITRSKNVTRGQLTEHLLPLIPGFKYNPQDARFSGQPIDYIIYDGLCNYRDNLEGDISIVFAEVKQGKSRRTKVQNKIKKAIEAGNVRFETITLDYGYNYKNGDRDGTNDDSENVSKEP